MPFSQEFFYLDENGEHQDAELHEDILAGAVVPPAIDIAEACGLTSEEIASLFGTRVRDAEFDEDKHPRDDHGRWIASSLNESPRGQMEVHNVISDLISADVQPELVSVAPEKIRGTQTRLATKSKGKAVYRDYADHPVGLADGDFVDIVDGHHRASVAFDRGEPIKIYVFKEPKS